MCLYVEFESKLSGNIVLMRLIVFWYRRYGQFVDPFGQKWSVSTPLSPERTEAARKEYEEWKKSGAAGK